MNEILNCGVRWIKKFKSRRKRKKRWVACFIYMLIIIIENVIFELRESVI